MPNITTRFCLLAITLVTVFFWYRSVQVREPWNVPTFMQISNWLEHKQHITAATLAYVNNWLKDGPSALYFGQYFYPKSVEMPALADRKYHPSYPPMITFGLYALFKTLEVTGIVPDIYYQRGAQILIVIWLNHILHLMLALSVCLLAFVTTRRLGFDDLNSGLMAITPAIVLFHNAGSLYWYNHLFIAPIIIIPVFTFFVLLELLRDTNLSSHLRKVIQVGQPLLMFVGVFMGWLFPFVITVVYIARLIRKEIDLPWRKFFSWSKQSFLFYWPALLALGIWVYTIVLYQQNVATNSFLNTSTSSLGNTPSHNLLHKLGIVDFHGNLAGFEQKIFWYGRAFYEHITHDYGLVAFVLIFGALYLAIQYWRQNGKMDTATVAYLLLLAPPVLYGLILTVDDANHHFTSVKYAPALAVSFIVIPIFVAQIRKKNPLMSALRLPDGKAIALVTIIAIVSSSLWAYTQIYSSKGEAKLFTAPQFHHLAVGKIIRDNTDYHDVVFSPDYYFPKGAFYIHNHFTIKAMHFADNLDIVYHKTSHIKENFTVKVFYYKRLQREIAHLREFLKSQQLATSTIEKMPVGGLLSFDGKQFHSWYEDEYCNEFPDTKFC